MVGTLEEFVAKKQQERHPPSDLSQFDRDLIGSAVRLTVPFASRAQMRAVAGILRAYADTIDAWARREDLEDRSILMHLKMEAKLANWRIKDLCSPSLSVTQLRR